jgi:hypothetical protein
MLIAILLTCVFFIPIRILIATNDKLYQSLNEKLQTKDFKQIVEAE